MSPVFFEFLARRHQPHQKLEVGFDRGAGPAGVVGRDQGYGFNVLANRKPITLPRRSEVPPTRLAARRNCGLKPEDE